MTDLFQTCWQDVWGNAQVPDSGSVYTKPEIVDLILDLAGYDPRQLLLSSYRLLEPSCGDGAFVSAIVERLVCSEILHRSAPMDWNRKELERAILAVDISRTAMETTTTLIETILQRHGCPKARSISLAKTWTSQADFLLHDWNRQKFDFIVGNPPYVRMEELPPQVFQRYRNDFSTMTNRADLYIPFFECGLSLLSAKGVLAFICTNRWAKNQYGKALRTLLSSRYHVRHYINMEHTQPFLAKVSAYPAIVVIDRNQGQPTCATTIDDLEPQTLARIRQETSSPGDTTFFPSWYPGGAPWTSTCPKGQEQLQQLLRHFPTIEASAPGTRIGIGIATGSDKVFILPKASDEIEPSRQLPLLMGEDIAPQSLTWSGHWLINPFAEADDGALVDLNEYPGLARYLRQNEMTLRARHCAKDRPQTWFRTIDRLWPKLVGTPKLVIPDIQPGGIIGYDSGKFYPHHNVYWITSESWNLQALQTILRSGHVTRQIRAHSVEMRGGSLRYQAQALRQIRIPSLKSIGKKFLQELAKLANSSDQILIDTVTKPLFDSPPNTKESDWKNSRVRAFSSEVATIQVGET